MNTKLINKLADRKNMLSEIFGIFVISRALIAFIGYLSNLTIIKGSWASSFPKHDSLLNLFFKWDSQWYMAIVQNGYSYTPEKASKIGFFPLYPMLVKISSSVFGSPKLMGFLISNIALFFAAVYLYELAAFDFGDSRVSSKTVFYMLVSPFSFFFSIFYTEGLFLFLTISAFYYARKRQWLAASVLGYFASLTRAPGVFLIIPFIVEYFDTGFKNFKTYFGKVKKDILYLLLIPAGLCTFLFYSYVKFNDIFAYYHAQYFHPQRAEVFKGLASVFTTLKSTVYYPLFHNVIFLGSIILALLLALYLIYSRARASYSVYPLVLLFAALLIGRLEGIHRYVSVLFPLYLGMGLITSRSKFFDYLFTVFSLSLLTLSTTLFVNGYWFP